MPAMPHPAGSGQAGGPAGVPCAARPATGFRHLDGVCECFFGGSPPAFPAASDPAGRAARASGETPTAAAA